MAGGELQGSCALENAGSVAEIQCALIGLVVEKVRAGIHPGLAAKVAGVVRGGWGFVRVAPALH